MRRRRNKSNSATRESAQAPSGRRRQLSVEPLEVRRLLAGDVCGISEQTLGTQPGVENGVAELHIAGLKGVSADVSVEAESVILGASMGVPSQVAVGVQNLRASDVAGETLATAADLGAVEGRVQRRGRLSRFDRMDLVRFETVTESDVAIRLDRLTRDADLHVLDSEGTVIVSSTRSGRRVESLAGDLSAGEYFLAIVAQSRRSSSYRLTLEVVATEPAGNSPSDRAPVASPTSPNARPAVEPATGDSSVSDPSASGPIVVAPLADVSYFGASHDWNLNAVGAPAAWAAGYTGEGITVAVVDTGVDLDHPDLVGNLYVNPGEIAGNGVDDDGNGFVDDVNGYDFVSGDSRPDDTNGHGTHVAGTIAAANNGIGATGVAPDARILPVRVLGGNGSGTDSSVAAGIRYAAEVGAHIINLSLGGGYSTRIANAIEYATSLGSLVVAAAGNESASDPAYPARYSALSSSVLSVGAFDSRERIAGFSNDVGRSGSVQVDAPGVGIYSTYVGGGYGSLSGTSMASPHVAALAALTLSANPNLTSPELRSLLVSGTIGKSVGSDAIGNSNARYSVAFAAAGLTASGQVADSGLAAASDRVASVRATQGVPNASVSDMIPNPVGSASKDSGEEELDLVREILFSTVDSFVSFEATENDAIVALDAGGTSASDQSRQDESGSEELVSSDMVLKLGLV